MLTVSLRRGLAAGLVAGLLAGLVAVLSGGGPLQEATALESAADHHAPDAPRDAHADHDDAGDHHASPAGHEDGHEDGHGHGDEHARDDEHDHADEAGHGNEAGDGHGHAHAEVPVPDGAQPALLPAATALIGVGLGGLFGLAFAFVRPRLRAAGSDWSANLRLGATAWACLVLVPTLVHPADPPGAADPETLTTRTTAWLVSVGLSLAGAVALWLLARRLADRPAPVRHLAVGAATVIGVGALVAAVPSAEPVGGFPGHLLWEFRLASLATLTTLWVGIAVVSGLLWERSRTAVGA